MSVTLHENPILEGRTVRTREFVARAAFAGESPVFILQGSSFTDYSTGSVGVGNRHPCDAMVFVELLQTVFWMLSERAWGARQSIVDMRSSESPSSAEPTDSQTVHAASDGQTTEVTDRPSGRVGD